MQKTIQELLKKGILLSPEIIDKKINILDAVSKIEGDVPIVFDSKDLKNLHLKNSEEPISDEITTKKPPNLDYKLHAGVKIIKSFKEKNSKKSLADFVNLYNDRYRILQEILKNRQELQGATTIRNVKSAQENGRKS